MSPSPEIRRRSPKAKEFAKLSREYAPSTIVSPEAYEGATGDELQQGIDQMSQDTVGLFKSTISLEEDPASQSKDKAIRGAFRKLEQKFQKDIESRLQFLADKLTDNDLNTMLTDAIAKQVDVAVKRGTKEEEAAVKKLELEISATERFVSEIRETKEMAPEIAEYAREVANYKETLSDDVEELKVRFKELEEALETGNTVRAEKIKDEITDLRERVQATKALLEFAKEDLKDFKKYKTPPMTSREGRIASSEVGREIAAVDMAILEDLKDTYQAIRQTDLGEEMKRVLDGQINDISKLWREYSMGDIGPDEFAVTAQKIVDAESEIRADADHLLKTRELIKRTKQAIETRQLIDESAAKARQLVDADVAESETRAATREEKDRREAYARETREIIEEAKAKKGKAVEEELEEIRAMDPETGEEKAKRDQEAPYIPPSMPDELDDRTDLEKAMAEVKTLEKERIQTELEMADRIAKEHSKQLELKKAEPEIEESLRQQEAVFSTLSGEGRRGYLESLKYLAEGGEGRDREANFPGWSNDDLSKLYDRLTKMSKEEIDQRREESKKKLDSMYGEYRDRMDARVTAVEDKLKKEREKVRRESSELLAKVKAKRESVGEEGVEKEFFAVGESTDALERRQRILDRFPDMTPEDAMREQRKIELVSEAAEEDRELTEEEQRAVERFPDMSRDDAIKLQSKLEAEDMPESREEAKKKFVSLFLAELAKNRDRELLREILADIDPTQEERVPLDWDTDDLRKKIMAKDPEAWAEKYFDLLEKDIARKAKTSEKKGLWGKVKGIFRRKSKGGMTSEEYVEFQTADKVINKLMDVSSTSQAAFLRRLNAGKRGRTRSAAPTTMGRPPR